MLRHTHTTYPWRRICLLLLCLLLCIVLMTGVTFARYRQEFAPVSYTFQADSNDMIVLGGVVTQTWLESGQWPPVAQGWTTAGESALLEFSVSNGTPADGYARRDQIYTVQLIAGLGIGAPENLTVTLLYEEDAQPVQLTGVAEPIQEGSLIYKSCGDGWVYRFCDAAGNEIQFELSGGALRYQNYLLAVAGDVDPVLTKLQVTGSYAE